jgi:ribosomal protein S18 acetylase RimI-like enzyme
MWITVFPVSAPSPESNGSPPSDPLFILSLLSPWPGVLGSSVEPHELDRAILLDAISTLVNAAIGAGVTPQRLTSIIGPKVLVDPFMDAWDTAASVKRSPKPVLHMYLAHVERATLRPPTRASPADVTLGQCTLEDLDVVAVMCERFAATTPHPLDTRVAFAHAKMILEAKQLYGARINGQLRCIVCVTRPTPGNMAISKVWTEPEARGKGLAEALVRYAVERCVSSMRQETP